MVTIEWKQEMVLFVIFDDSAVAKKSFEGFKKLFVMSSHHARIWREFSLGPFEAVLAGFIQKTC